MSKADKMFEEMGFKRSEELFKYKIIYHTKQTELGRFVVFDEAWEYVEINGTIKPKLHLAIHEKMKELGWIE